MAQGKRNHEGVSRDFFMRCSFIITLLLLGGVSTALGKSPNTHPNVIFFLVDDLGQCDVACYESTFHKTPAIDQLALDGMLSTDACSTCHVCSPSRTSILTGKYPARLNLTDWLPGRPERDYESLHSANRVNALPLSEITPAQTLQQYTQKNKPISSPKRVQKLDAFYLPLGRHKSSQ
jgi:arylsulfatase A